MISSRMAEAGPLTVGQGKRIHEPDAFGEGAAVELGPTPKASLVDDWRQIEAKLNQKNRLEDPNEYVSDDIVGDAYRVATKYPENVSIRTTDVGRDEDLQEHVQGHFDSLFNNPNWATPLKEEFLDVDRLLKASELVYILDGAFRFADKSIVTADNDQLDPFEFYNIDIDPDTETWIGTVDLLWKSFHQPISPKSKKSTQYIIDDMHDERIDFMSTASDDSMFLAIHPDKYPFDDDNLRRHIRSHVSRQGSVDTSRIHNECFKRVNRIFDDEF